MVVEFVLGEGFEGLFFGFFGGGFTAEEVGEEFFGVCSGGGCEGVFVLAFLFELVGDEDFSRAVEVVCEVFYGFGHVLCGGIFSFCGFFFCFCGAGVFFGALGGGGGGCGFGGLAVEVCFVFFLACAGGFLLFCGAGFGGKGVGVALLFKGEGGVGYFACGGLDVVVEVF